MRRGIFCWTELDSVRWAFDGVSDQLVPACRECCERLHAKVWRVDPGEGRDLPTQAECAYCGQHLPSADTWPVIVWVKVEHGLAAVCNACRIRHDRETQFASLPFADWEQRPAPE